MSPAQLILSRREELQERRMGMRSLDPMSIQLHFNRAAELRAFILKNERPRIVAGPSGTKGSRPLPQ